MYCYPVFLVIITTTLAILSDLCTFFPRLTSACNLDTSLPLRLTPACVLDFDFVMSSSTVTKDYGSWSLSDLKKELRKRNAKCSGKKAMLVQRLEDYDKLFGPLVTDPELVYKIIVPAPQHFRDVTSDSAMPALRTEDMESFCQMTERDDLATSHNMYEENFLLACRIATVNNENFVCGVVASEMRKNVTYNVAVKLKNHLIIEAQCECAAGMGPYSQCKHVLVVILGIIDMHVKKTIKIKNSVTSMVQKFHQPTKLYSGEPYKAEDIKLKFNDEQYKKMAAFDPRPTIESAEIYSNNFKSKIANFCGQPSTSSSTCTMPMAHLIKPADKASVFGDHDYLEKTNEEAYLDSLILTEEEIVSLEEKTRLNKKLWKKERLTRIHSSNYGKIIKASSNAMQKLANGLVENVDILTPPIKHGIKYEDEAVRQFELLTKLATTKCGIIVDKNNQFLASTPDRLVGETCVLEVKCPFTARNEKISPEYIPYIRLCDQTGLIKLNENHNYYYQVQGQMMCTGREMAYFCIYTFCDFVVIEIKRNNHFIENMRENLKKFYNDYFKETIVKKFLYNKR